MKQVGGTHYINLVLQPVHIFAYYRLNWFQSEPIKYVSRYINKNGLEDLNKAKSIILDSINTYNLQDDKVDYINRTYILDSYIDQFKNDYFIEPQSYEIFKELIPSLVKGDFEKAKELIVNLIYSEYGV